VTPKGERLDEDFVSELRRPFYVFYAIVAAGLVWGGVRIALEPEVRQTLWLSVLWLCFNFVLLSAALGTLLERAQRRSRPRVRVGLSGELHTPQQHWPLAVVDMNEGSALVRAIGEPPVWPEHAELEVSGLRVPVQHLRRRSDAGRPREAVLLFKPATPAQQRALVAQAYGSSERWSRLWQARAATEFFPATIVRFTAVALRGAWRHLRFIARRRNRGLD
jgi:cellulose synthase (UDP-forming)